jgi:hypothetical protein
MNRDNVAFTATWLRARLSAVRIPVMARDSLLQKTSTPALRITQPPISRVPLRPYTPSLLGQGHIYLYSAANVGLGILKKRGTV